MFEEKVLVFHSSSISCLIRIAVCVKSLRKLVIGKKVNVLVGVDDFAVSAS